MAHFAVDVYVDDNYIRTVRIDAIDDSEAEELVLEGLSIAFDTEEIE